MENKKLETAMFGAGCFWGVEDFYRKEKGVRETVVGYSGGFKPDPTYEDVCTDETNHAEVVVIKFTPVEISYKKLLEIFWENHDPTSQDRQGPDIGTQFRSVIFYYSSEQQRFAEASRDAIDKSGKYRTKIVTQIAPAEQFWKAEDYHQRYYERKCILK